MSAPVDDWGALLEANPNVLWSLVADVVKAVKAGEGERKTGRRPAVSVASLDELYDLLFPVTYSGLPFNEAFLERLGDKSLRQFSRETGISQRTVARLACAASGPHEAGVGHERLNLSLIELVAAGLGVRPSYFREYRAHKIGQAVTQVLLADPVRSSVEHTRRLFLGVPA